MRQPRKITMEKVDYELTRLTGGLDLETPALSLLPGFLRQGVNFEVAKNGGYTRIPGYERFDGRAAPSAASFQIIAVASFTNVPATGLTVTQATSGATGTIVAVDTTNLYLAVTQVTGTFDTTHSLTVPGPVTVGTAVVPSIALSALLTAQYTNLSADVYRALIGAVPGSGAILGIATLNVSGTDTTFAFRANGGGTAVNIYKSTTGGWVQVTLLNEVAFTAGSTATPADGATLTQGGVTATVRRVVQQSGAWSGTAAGTFVITNPAGGNFAAGAATLTGGAAVTLSGVQTAIVILPGGHYEMVKTNFAGQAGTTRLYGADGVNRAFEFDGTTYVPIHTSLTTDTPLHITVHQKALMLSYLSSVFVSPAGFPFKWNATDGAVEIATGNVVTGMLTMPGAQTTAALAIYNRTDTMMLYGTGSTTWNLVTYNTGTGGIDNTVQNLEDSYVFAPQGIVTLTATINFGNFDQATLTKNISTLMATLRTQVVDSIVCQEKSQYRIFFNDRSALYLTIVNGKYLGAAQMLFSDLFSCAWQGKLADGTEVMFVGGHDSGYVYQLDMGTSFDGQDIVANFTTTPDPLKGPRIEKHFRAASLEVQGSAYATMGFGYALEYGNPNVPQPASTAYASAFQAAPAWDSFVWDNFTWDGATLGPTDVDVTGDATNIAAAISTGSDYIAAFTINSVIWHFTPRRGVRNGP